MRRITCLVTLLVVACTPPQPSTGGLGTSSSGSTTTGGTGTTTTPTQPTGTGPAEPPTVFSWSAPQGMGQYFGASLAVTPWAGSIALVIGAPSLGSYSNFEVGTDSWLYLVADPTLADPGLPRWDTYVRGSVAEHINPRLGESLTAVGDVTGDGEPDLAAFDHPDDAEFDGNHCFLDPGPLLAKKDYYIEDDLLSLSSASALRGAPCGDLDGDGVAELCTNQGIYDGPVLAGAVPSVTWSPAAPTEDVLVAAVDDATPDLLLWDPATSAVRRLTGFPAGDLDPATAASASWTAPGPGTATALVAGDLDADGDPDLAIAWTDGSTSSVFLATDDAGGQLDAGTVIDLPATALAVGDVDGDGAADLVVGGDSAVHIFLGPFSPGTLPPEDAVAWWIGAEYPTDHFGDALLAADLDGDGEAEVVIGAPETGTGPDNPLSIPKGQVYGVAGGTF